MKDLYIRTDQHVFIPGQTGSGKSYLAERYLAGYEYVVMLDTKGEMLDRFEENQRRKKKKLPEKPLWNGVDPSLVTLVTHLSELEAVKTPKIIYSPAYEELNDEYYNEFFRWCYFRRNCIVWVDEAMSVCTVTRIPEYYKAILTRGRSRNTAVWSLTQRPKGLNSLVMSQSTHYFAFNLQLEQDRDKLVDVTGAPEFEDKPGKYKFWYFKDGWEHAILAQLVEK